MCSSLESQYSLKRTLLSEAESCTQPQLLGLQPKGHPSEAGSPDKEQGLLTPSV